MSFSGDGLSFRGIVGSEDDYKMTVEQRSSFLNYLHYLILVCLMIY